MNKKRRRLSVLFTFIIFTTLGIFLFIQINKSRDLSNINQLKKNFELVLDLTSDMLSSGYFQWDDVYEAVKNSDKVFLDDTFLEIIFLNEYITSIKIIDEKPENLSKWFTKKTINNKIVVNFNVYDSRQNNVLRDHYVQVTFNKIKIMRNIQSKNIYLLEDTGNYDFLYENRLRSQNPPILIFQLISSIGIGLLCALILNRVYYTHSHFFYETRGLQKIIFLFEQTERFSANHSKNVAAISYILGEKYGLKRRTLKDLKVAALLHDIGKISVPREILNKVDPLTEKEFDIIKEHATFADRILEDFEELSHLRTFIKHHHEKMDGTGYPSGLKGNEIPLQSRIIAVADIFEALTGERPYRKPLEPLAALSFMKRMSLDQDILILLEKNIHLICNKIHIAD